MTTFELITVIVATASALFVAIGLFYAARQLRLLIRTHADNHEWNRRIAAQEAVAQVNTTAKTEDLNARFNYIAHSDPVPLAEVNEAFEEDPGLRVKLNVLLNSYEGLARGVFLGIYSEAVIKSARRSPMLRTFNAFREYINHRRISGSPLVWVEYEKIIDKWTAEQKATVKMEPIGSVQTGSGTNGFN